ncbi:hypothetical protein WA026_011448 [Henosepilachna vigintioctopunctata]|uniref:Uncharacterized protein n=1 Tax=Henosepilachna vigintioctopunctata TaxID=420089 RepID=A0AAW1TJK8_9CUCU
MRYFRKISDIITKKTENPGLGFDSRYYLLTTLLNVREHYKLEPPPRILEYTRYIFQSAYLFRQAELTATNIEMLQGNYLKFHFNTFYLKSGSKILWLGPVQNIF